MGRKARHTAKTGDGGAERRHAKRLKQQHASKNFNKTEDDLVFHDDPSDNDDNVQNESEEEIEEEEILQLDETEDESELEERDDLGDEDFDEEGFNEEKERVEKMKDQWGSSKQQFYSADTADYEMDSDMEDIAKDEEEAALELQRKQAELMDEDDFAVADAEDVPVDEDEEARVGDELADIPLVYGEENESSIEQVEKDFSKFSKKEKLAFVQQASPELIGLIDEMKSYLEQLKQNIQPAIVKLEQWVANHGKHAAGLEYMKMKEQLVLNYTMNISFYLQCKAQGKNMVDHPVLTHILSLQEKLQKCEAIDEPLDGELDSLLNEPVPEAEVDDGMDAFFTTEEEPEETSLTTTSKKSSKKRKQVEEEEDEDANAFYESIAREKSNQKKIKQDFYTHEPKIVEPEYDDEEDEDKKRGATYQMIKNRGLKAHKSKINRNPRVKKRMQYKKALVRRKGQVRDIRTGEAARYGGEMTGIKSNITRSRKL